MGQKLLMTKMTKNNTNRSQNQQNNRNTENQSGTYLSKSVFPIEINKVNHSFSAGMSHRSESSVTLSLSDV